MSRWLHDDFLWPKPHYEGIFYRVNTMCKNNPYCMGHFHEIGATLPLTEDELVPKGFRRMSPGEEWAILNNEYKVRNFYNLN